MQQKSDGPLDKGNKRRLGRRATITGANNNTQKITANKRSVSTQGRTDTQSPLANNKLPRSKSITSVDNNTEKKKKSRNLHSTQQEEEPVSPVLLTEEELAADFTYSPQTEHERLVLESNVIPIGGKRLDNNQTILLGKWMVKKLGIQTNTDHNLIKNAMITFIDNFSFLYTHQKGFYAFQRIVLDSVSVSGELVNTVLKSLVNQLRTFHTIDSSPSSSDKSPPTVIIGKFKFRSLAEVRKKCRHILQNTEQNVDLSGDDLSFILNLLQYHPNSENKKKHLESIYVGIHPYAKTRCYFVRRNADTGADEDFSYVRASLLVPNLIDDGFKRICETLAQIVVIFPRCSTELTELLSQRYPKFRIDVDEQLIYLKACLWFAQRLPNIRRPILKTVLSNITAMDAEIKTTDTENYMDKSKFIAWKEEQLHTLANEVEKNTVSPDTIKWILSQKGWFESMYLKVRSEEDIDGMIFKLDILMHYLFSWTDKELIDSQHIQAPAHLISTSLMGVSSAEDDDDENSSATCYSDCPTKKDNLQLHNVSLTMADIIVADILGIFRSIILPTERCRYVQFYVFYVTSLKIQWAEKFLQILFGILFNPDSAIPLVREHSTIYSHFIIQRRICANYIASFICRGIFLPIKFCTTALQYLLQFLTEFLLWWNQRDQLNTNQQDNKTDTPYKIPDSLKLRKATLNPNSRLTLFYSVCQAACYIVCFYGDCLRWGCELLQQELIQPTDIELQHSVPTALSFLTEGSGSLVSALCCDLAPLIQCKRCIVEEFIRTCRRVGEFKQLEDHFQLFEKMILTESDHPPIEEFDQYLGFPFDVYDLRQSSCYLDPLYRSWKSVEIIKAASDKISLRILASQEIGCPVIHHSTPFLKDTEPIVSSHGLTTNLPHILQTSHSLNTDHLLEESKKVQTPTFNHYDILNPNDDHHTHQHILCKHGSSQSDNDPDTSQLSPHSLHFASIESNKSPSQTDFSHTILSVNNKSPIQQHPTTNCMQTNLEELTLFQHNSTIESQPLGLTHHRLMTTPPLIKHELSKEVSDDHSQVSTNCCIHDDQYNDIQGNTIRQDSLTTNHTRTNSIHHVPWTQSNNSPLMGHQHDHMTSSFINDHTSDNDHLNLNQSLDSIYEFPDITTPLHTMSLQNKTTISCSVMDDTLVSKEHKHSSLCSPHNSLSPTHLPQSQLVSSCTTDKSHTHIIEHESSSLVSDTQTPLVNHVSLVVPNATHVTTIDDTMITPVPCHNIIPMAVSSTPVESVTIPASTFNALLTALLNMTSSSTASCIPNVLMSQQSIKDLSNHHLPLTSSQENNNKVNDIIETNSLSQTISDTPKKYNQDQPMTSSSERYLLDSHVLSSKSDYPLSSITTYLSQSANSQLPINSTYTEPTPSKDSFRKMQHTPVKENRNSCVALLPPISSFILHQEQHHTDLALNIDKVPCSTDDSVIDRPRSLSDPGVYIGSDVTLLTNHQSKLTTLTTLQTTASHSNITVDNIMLQDNSIDEKIHSPCYSNKILSQIHSQHITILPNHQSFTTHLNNKENLMVQTPIDSQNLIEKLLKPPLLDTHNNSLVRSSKDPICHTDTISHTPCSSSKIKQHDGVVASHYKKNPFKEWNQLRLKKPIGGTPIRRQTEFPACHYLTTPILDLSEDTPINVLSSEQRKHNDKCSGPHHLLTDYFYNTHSRRRFSLDLPDMQLNHTQQSHVNDEEDLFFDSRDVMFRPTSAAFREEQILEELEPFLEWDARGVITSNKKNILNSATFNKTTERRGSRLTELLNTKAYKSSLAVSSPKQYTAQLSKKKRKKKLRHITNGALSDTYIYHTIDRSRHLSESPRKLLLNSPSIDSRQRELHTTHKKKLLRKHSVELNDDSHLSQLNDVPSTYCKTFRKPSSIYHETHTNHITGPTDPTQYTAAVSHPLSPFQLAHTKRRSVSPAARKRTHSVTYETPVSLDAAQKQRMLSGIPNENISQLNSQSLRKKNTIKNKHTTLENKECHNKAPVHMKDMPTSLNGDTLGNKVQHIPLRQSSRIVQEHTSSKKRSVSTPVSTQYHGNRHTEDELNESKKIHKTQRDKKRQHGITQTSSHSGHKMNENLSETADNKRIHKRRKTELHSNV